MEEVLESAGTLENFLKSPQLIDQYYRACRSYYVSKSREDVGGGFPRPSFDAVLKQFKALISRHPEFAERAWRKRPIRPLLSIRTDHPGYGVSQKENFPANFARKLVLNESDFAKPTVPANLAVRLGKFKLEWNRIRFQEVSSRAEKNNQKNALKSLKSDHETLELRSDLLRKILTFSKARTLLQDPQADIVLSAYKQLRERGAELMPELAIYREEIEYLLSTLPQVETLAGDRTLFRPADEMEWVDNAQFEFVDIARPFHSIFRGLFHKECTGGDNEHLHWLHESRWAIPLLEGGHEIHVVRDGVYTGYISNVLVERDRHRYFALELLTPNMHHRIWNLREFEGQVQMVKRSLLDVWIDREMVRNSGEVEGFLAGQSYALNPAGGLQAIKISEAWAAGKVFGHTHTFKPADPFAPALTETPKNRMMNPDYLNKALIYELGVIPSGQAVLMKSSDFDFRQLNNQYWIAREFAQGLDREIQLWAALWFYPKVDEEGSGVYLKERARTILQAFKNSHALNHEFGKQFMERCDYFCLHGLFRYRYPGDFDLAALDGALREASFLPENAGNIQLWLVKDKLFSAIYNLGDTFPVVEMKRLLGKHVSPTAIAVVLNETLDRVASADDFLFLTPIPSNDAQTRYDFSLVLLNQLPNFVRFNPTSSQWNVFFSRLYSTRHHFLALRAALHLAPSPRVMFDRMEWPPSSLGDMGGQRKEFDLVLSELASRFLELGPNEIEMEHYLNKILDPKIRGEVTALFGRRRSCQDEVTN